VEHPLYQRPTRRDRRKDPWSWQLGRVLGIPTRIHASFALVLVWIGISTWRTAHSGLAVAFGVGFALTVFACVLLHEFGHALVARRFGIETTRITLLPVGGLAQLERAPETPRAELWIALAGPAVNLGIAAVLAAVGFGTGLLTLTAAGLGTGGGGILAIVLSGLLYANLMLGLFNLLPAFPMDGGRVFRAWAQTRYGRLEATRKAATLGRVLALGFGVWGIWASNPVLVLVAVFVYFAARRERQMVELQFAAEASRNQASGNQVFEGRAFEGEVLEGRVVQVQERDTRR